MRSFTIVGSIVLALSLVVGCGAAATPANVTAPITVTGSSEMHPVCGSVPVQGYYKVTIATAGSIADGHAMKHPADGIARVSRYDQLVLVNTESFVPPLKLWQNAPEKGDLVSIVHGDENVAVLQVPVASLLITNSPTDQRFLIPTQDPAAACGSEVYDSKGRFVGITAGAFDNGMTYVITARAIANAVNADSSI